MALVLADFLDTNFILPEQRGNKSLIRYNHSNQKFDLVYIDTTLGIITDSPQQFSDEVALELIINNITNNIIDGGNF